MKEIKLTQGKVAIVDDADFEWLSQWKWHFHHSGYAARTGSRPVQRTIHMHREVNQTPDGLSTDHINGNKLDNRRENLRSCTRAENNRNIGKLANNKSGYKGVHWLKRGRRWQAQTTVAGKRVHLGVFDSAQEAAVAYDAFVLQEHGKFARPNSVANR